MSASYSRSAYGVEVRETLIFQRALELSHKLCWNPQDLGITRVHIHPEQRREFESRSALKKFCEERGETIPEDSYRFDWLPPMKELVGIDRQTHLRDEFWCNREQVVNILFDTAMQAYREDSRRLLSAITGEDFMNADLVKLEILNPPRQFTGDPDSTFIDLKSRNIALVEIKIGRSASKSTTKYSLKQSVKYETMATLLCSEKFFPGFRVHKMLLGPKARFSEITDNFRLLGPSADSEGRISFTYSPSALQALKPSGHTEGSGLIRARLEKLSKGGVRFSGQIADFGVLFFSWPTVEKHAPHGLLRENISALMRYLAPSPQA